MEQSPTYRAGFALYITLDGMNIFVAASPEKFSSKEIDDFVAFVLAGGEVSSTGLRARVVAARCLSFTRKGECLVGVAGLKQPSPTYRTRVQSGSKCDLSKEEFPFELGWVFILPSARGQKLSLPLCKPVAAAAGSAGVFATSRSTNLGMHATLEKLGFKSIGSKWASKQSKDKLQLFVRHAV